MQELLFPLGQNAFRRWWLPLVAWILIVAGMAPAAAVFSSPLSQEFSITDLPSLTTRDLMDERSPPVTQDKLLPLGRIVVQVPEGETLSDPELYAKLQELVSTGSEPSGCTDDLDTVELLIPTDYTATDPGAARTLKLLREHVSGGEASTILCYGVTVMTPIFVDLSARLTDALLPHIALVLVLAMIVTALIFRSLWVPFVTTAGCVLSMGATFGLTVALFQQGIFGIVDNPQLLVSFVPIIMISLAFNLSMDYHVFLVSGMYEAWKLDNDADEAISYGFRHSARVV